MTSISIPQLLDQGLRLHTAGQLSQAEQIYRQVLAAQPRNPDALHLLGVIAHQAGRHDVAVKFIEQAISIHPNNPAYHNNLGEAYRNLNRIDDAGVAYRKAIELAPNSADSWSNLSIVLLLQNRVDDAIEAARRAISINPNLPTAYANLGQAIADRNPQEALNCFLQSLRLNPRQPAILSNAACLLTRFKQLDPAIDAARQAVTLDPNFPDGWSQLSYALGLKGLSREAIDAAQRAIALDGSHANAYTNLGFALDLQNRIPEVIDALANALRCKPDFAEGWKNLGVAHFKMGDTDQSQRCYAKAVELDPTYAEAHVNLATALLAKGQWEQGLEEYEWRWRLPSFIASKPREITTPWDGSDAPGKTILLVTEQGAGDAFHFARYIPMVVAKGLKVIVACPESIHKVMMTVQGVSGVIAPDAPDPGSDFQLHLLSLPRLFKTRPDNIPADVPYISADPEKVKAWKDRLANDPPGYRVAISWAGNPLHSHDRTRSCKLADFAPLASIENVVFYSLQKGEPAIQAANPPPGMKLIDYTNDLNDFSDTAALLENIDLLISVDTSVIHLAGAMARPVWTLITIGPDFRWFKDRTDTPWYPTMKLFRQPKVLDWPGVFQEVKTVLEAEVTPSRRST